ncbi:hypothetical protein L1987_50292 [Smallanthus sonchifolius]|uniref:Uncharacterized protein n=1 Tax=Smallanthus sonchifolius TaxID=185202 RepID=A0ACB9EM24_9ASTR|nr:hypothetical protein L1987_50292 [Smallanthus sonchifolius]
MLSSQSEEENPPMVLPPPPPPPHTPLLYHFVEKGRDVILELGNDRRSGGRRWVYKTDSLWRCGCDL